MYIAKKYSRLFSRDRLFLLSRKLSTDNNNTNNCMEIEIPVPWGKIAGKWWGPTDKRPIVCIHGWQDNCNTYDRLIPLLPKQSYLALDYPGHGLSSQYPHGMFYYPTDFPIILRRIHKYFGWAQISIIAHSLGASLSYIYASLYPNDVDIFISIDGSKPRSYKPGGIIEKMAKTIDNFIKHDGYNTAGEEPPSYEPAEVANKLYEGSFGSINLDKAEILYKRNTKPSDKYPGKLYFTRDTRLKSGSMIGWQHDDLKEFVKRIKCPTIFIRTIRSRINEEPHYLKDAVEVMKKHNPKFEFLELDGKHHDHLNEPEKIAIVINKFMAKYDTPDKHASNNQAELIKSKI